MKNGFNVNRILIGILVFLMIAVAHAGIPVWTFTPDPNFPPKISVSPTETASVKYTIANQSKKPHTLVMLPQKGVTQTQPCELGPKGSINSTCILTLIITGKEVPRRGILGGPALCQTHPNGIPNLNQCYQPSPGNILNITTTSVPRLVSIQVTPPIATIAQGTTQQFMATGIFSDGTHQDMTDSVTWTSSNPGIATISDALGSKGLATGLNASLTPVLITVTLSNTGISGTAQLIVTGATLTSINVNPPSAVIAQSTTQQFTATGIFSDGTHQDITNLVVWTSSNLSIATISNASGSQGLATGLTASTTPITITATLESTGVSGTAQLTVTSATLVSLIIIPPTASIAKNTTQQFTATGIFSDGTEQDLTNSVIWASSNPDIAIISDALGSKGLATGLNASTIPVTITAIMRGTGISASAQLTVTAATLTSITVTPPIASIAKGTTLQYTATGLFSDGTTQIITNEVTWISSNPDIANISDALGSQGLATGLNASTIPVTITAIMGGTGISASAQLTVTAATLTSIIVTPPIASIAKGTTLQYTATGLFSDQSSQDLTKSVTWASSNPNIASISDALGSQGLATGLNPSPPNQPITITAIMGGTGISGTAQLTVTSATLISIAVTPSNPSIASGTTQQFIATGNFSDGTTQPITTEVAWNSLSSNIAIISNEPGAQGLATGRSPGVTTITATLYINGVEFTGQTQLTVTNAILQSITVLPENEEIANGTTLQYTAIGNFSDETTQDLTTEVAWSSLNPNIASISDTPESKGLTTGLHPGVTTIKATMYNSHGVPITGQTRLTVTNAILQSITVSPPSATIARGTTQQFTAIGNFSNGESQDITNQVTWISLDANIASISNESGSQGLATGLSPSPRVTIVAVLNKIGGMATLTVTNAVLVSIDVEPPMASIAQGTQQQYTAKGLFSDQTTQNLTYQVDWQSSESIAVIDRNGRATGLSTGNTLITATLYIDGRGFTGVANLKVTNATLQSISVFPPRAFIANGTTQQYEASGTFDDGTTQDITDQVDWESSNVNIAEINPTGNAKGISTGGPINIIATMNGIEGKANLTVTNAILVSITVLPANEEIAKGTNLQYTAIGNFSDQTTQNLTDQVSWTSSNTGTAVINLTGLATGVAAGGPINITATMSIEGKVISGQTGLTVTAAVLVSIDVEPPLPSIAQGMTQQFTATGIFSDGSTQPITTEVAWNSLDTEVAPIGLTGLATGLEIGATTITATKYSNGVPITGRATLTVNAAILQSITVVPSSATIPNGTTQQFQALGNFSAGPQQDITNQVSWTSSNTGIAVIEPNTGLATGVAAGGPINITATMNDSNGNPVSGTGSLTVTNAILQSITVVPSSATIPNGETQQFRALGNFSTGPQQDITNQVSWTSSNTGIAVINLTGLATGVAAGGPINITATMYNINRNPVSGTATLTVTDAILQAIAVTPANTTIFTGAELQYTATGIFSAGPTQDITQEVTWNSTNSGIASISNALGSKGLATGLNPGPTTIEATMDNITGATSLTVQAAFLTSIEIIPNSATIPNGTTQQFRANGTYSNGLTVDITTLVTWRSSNEATALISNAAGSEGLARGRAVGTVTISATLGLTATATLNVVAPLLVSINVTPEDQSIANGTTLPFTATGVYSDGSNQIITNTVTWSSSAETDVATISNNPGSQGLATAIGAGTTTITASLGGVSGNTQLTVTNAILESIIVTPVDPSLNIGASRPLTATGTFIDGPTQTTQDITNQVAWVSEFPTIASVTSPGGVVTGVSLGQTHVTASKQNTLGDTISGSTLVTVTNDPPTTIAIISTFVESLGLSVNDTATNPALTGNPREIIIENTGGAEAVNVTYNLLSALPEGSSISPLNTCGNIPIGGTCTLTITPGAIPSAPPGNLNPTPIILSIAGSNTNNPPNEPLTVAISVLTYGSVYQGGYIYAVDDTTPNTQSIGGKTVTLSDQAAQYPRGALWSSTNAPGGAYDGGVVIYAISQTSTVAVPNPNAGASPNQPLPGQNSCNGNSDGSCNSNNIWIYYQQPPTPITPSYYATGLCKGGPINGYSDWYLPAICEMGTGDAGCTPEIQDIAGNIPGLIGDPENNPRTSCAFGSNCLSGQYWSSTERAELPQIYAWFEFFNINRNFQSSNNKNDLYGVRCSRALTS